MLPPAKSRARRQPLWGEKGRSQLTQRPPKKRAGVETEGLGPQHGQGSFRSKQ